MSAGIIFNEILFGLCASDKKQKNPQTWFQFEGHSVRRDKTVESHAAKVVNGTLATFSFNSLNVNTFLHGLDFIQYVLTRKNVGQYGNSPNIEAKPIRLGPTKS